MPGTHRGAAVGGAVGASVGGAVGGAASVDIGGGAASVDVGGGGVASVDVGGGEASVAGPGPRSSAPTASLGIEASRAPERSSPGSTRASLGGNVAGPITVPSGGRNAASAGAPRGVGVPSAHPDTATRHASKATSGLKGSTSAWTDHPPGSTRKSTRRFTLRPASVSFFPMGRSSPKDSSVMRAGSMPRFTR